MNNAILQFFSFFFYPNPGNANYGSPKSLALLIFCILLMIAAAGISVWRHSLKNPVTKKLSKSWPMASFWFGFTGLIMVVARVEQIQFVAMRIWWVIWLAIAVLYILLQLKLFRMRHYEVLPKEVSNDPRATYLPKRKRR